MLYWFSSNPCKIQFNLIHKHLPGWKEVTEETPSHLQWEPIMMEIHCNRNGKRRKTAFQCSDWNESILWNEKKNVQPNTKSYPLRLSWTSCLTNSIVFPVSNYWLYDVLSIRPRFASSSNDAGCAWLYGRSASDFLRKAGGCNFLVANPTNQLFTAFHRDVISYNPTACHASFVALKGRNNVRFALARLIWSANTARQGRWWG